MLLSLKILSNTPAMARNSTCLLLITLSSILVKKLIIESYKPFFKRSLTINLAKSKPIFLIVAKPLLIISSPSCFSTVKPTSEKFISLGNTLIFNLESSNVIGKSFSPDLLASLFSKDVKYSTG